MIYEIRTGREMERGDDENRPKRRQTRGLGHRYVFITIPSYTKVMFYCIYRTITTTKTGSNDARRVVLGHRYVFFFFTFSPILILKSCTKNLG